MDDSFNRVLVFGSQILAVFLVVVGAVLQQSELRSSRPPGASKRISHDPLTGDRYARLWEDPLEGLQNFRSRETESSLQGVAQGSTETNVAPTLNPGSRKVGTDDRILWNLIDASPSPEATELRLRARYALVSALMMSGYKPMQDGILEAVEAPSGWRKSGEVAKEGSPTQRSVIAYLERFELRSHLRAEDDGTPGRVIWVYWHPEGLSIKSENGKSVTYDRHWKVRQLLSKAWEEVAVEGSSDEAVPATSGETAGNAAEPAEGNVEPPPGETDAPTSRILELGKNLTKPRFNPKANIHVLQYGSSTSLKAFMDKRPTGEDLEKTHFVRATIPNEYLGENTDGLKRPVLEDHKLVLRLIDELAARIPSLADTAPVGGSPPDGDKATDPAPRIVIISESDGDYGDNLKRLFTTNSGSRLSVETYGYLRGLDGLASEASQANQGGSGKDKAAVGSGKSNGGTAERSWGTSQYDYLRRLASQLRTDPAAEGGPPVAVGVLGTDIYDKLLVLQALRSELPDSIFFTTDLDSLYLSREHLPFTRNLIIASGEGLDYRPDPQSKAPGKPSGNLRDGVAHVRIPPMRDSYQTALVRAVWNIVHDPESTVPASEEALLWEVGSGTFVPLPKVDVSGQTVQRTFGSFLLASLGPPISNLFIFLFGLINAARIFLALAVLHGHETSNVHRTVPIAFRCTGIAIHLFLITFPIALVLYLSQGFGVGQAYTWGLAVAILVPLLIRFRSRIWNFLLGEKRERKASSPEQNKSGPPPLPTGLAWWLFWGEVAVAALCTVGLGLAVTGSLIGGNSGTSAPAMLAGEPLSPVLGVGIWPSILIRVLAFGIGLALLYKTMKKFVGMCTLARSEFMTAEKLFAGNTSVLSRIRARIERTLDPTSRFWPVIVSSIVYFFASLVLFRIWPSYVPGRGGISFAAEKITLSLGVGLYIIHLWYCVTLHVSSYRTIGRIGRKLRKQTPLLVSEFRSLLHEEAQAIHSTEKPSPPNLAKLPSTVRLKEVLEGAKGLSSGVRILTETVGVTLLYPLAILTLLLISRLRIFDDWNMMPSLLITFLFGALILLLSSVLLLTVSRDIRGYLTSALLDIEALFKRRKAEIEADAEDVPKKKVTLIAQVRLENTKQGIEQLNSITEGAFAPWYSQPIFIALMVALAVAGTTNLIEPILSLFI
ncbi:hypothetical protein [Luteolibacter marinus]|uniref:hypothetical protein n=1 Tax=Luteolibacter marinus TaxID=2776705 RepID=UPI001868BD9C|nr:hypothetical protein [Luteolibacter marinus]